MEFERPDGGNLTVSNSADECHQHGAQGSFREASRRVEVLVGPDKRRRWSHEDKARITAESFAPGVNVSAIARAYGVSQGLLHYWRRCARENTVATEDLRFIPVVKAEGHSERRGVEAGLRLRLEMNGASVVIDGDVTAATLMTVLTAIRGGV